MARFLIQQPNTPHGLFGTVSGDGLAFRVGQTHEMPVSRTGEIEEWVVTAIEPSPNPDYDALIVFAAATPREERLARD